MEERAHCCILAHRIDSAKTKSVVQTLAREFRDAKRILVVRSRHRWLAEREIPGVTAPGAQAVGRGVEDVRKGEIETVDVRVGVKNDAKSGGGVPFPSPTNGAGAPKLGSIGSNNLSMSQHVHSSLRSCASQKEKHYS